MSGRTPPPLPAALRPLQHKRRFIHWRWELRGNKWSKPPVSPSGDYIDATNAKYWLSFQQACDALEHAPTDGGYGLGFVLLDSGIGALDLDHVRRAGCSDLGIVSLWAYQLIKRAGSYTEITPSGAGLRILGTAAGDGVHTSRKMPGGGKLEIFRNTRRYITITGQRINKEPLRDLDGVINQLVAEHDATSRRTPQRIVVPNLKISKNGHLAAGDWREIARRFLVPPDRFTDPVADGWRSFVIWKIGRDMRERGASPAEVKQVLRAAKCFQDKHGSNNQQALDGEVERIFEKPLR